MWWTLALYNIGSYVPLRFAHACRNQPPSNPSGEALNKYSKPFPFGGNLKNDSININKDDVEN